MIRFFHCSALVCLLYLCAPSYTVSASQRNASITLSALARGDSVRAFAAALRDRNSVLIDSAATEGSVIHFINIPTTVHDAPGSQSPSGYWLEQNYPNPFNPSTRIRFHTSAHDAVRLEIFDILGRNVAVYSGTLEPGIHEFDWSTDASAGVYFYRVTAGSFTETKKMIKLDGGSVTTRSSLRVTGAAAAQASVIHRTEDVLQKTDAADYTIALYDLLRTDPQIADTVIRLGALTGDTTLSLSVLAAPQSVVIPMPRSMQMSDGSFTLTSQSVIAIDPPAPELRAIGSMFADNVRPATGYTLSVQPASEVPVSGRILLTLAGADTTLGEEGYRLTITAASVTLEAYKPAGLFYGVQTMRQLLPPAIEDTVVRPIIWKLQTGTIEDRPRFGWRGAMQDIARHFFGLDDLKRLVDEYSYYKLNRLHLHLTDDSWGIEIKSWPELAPNGRTANLAATLINHPWLTQAQYSELCAYAAQRFVTIVPEIEVPGHFYGALEAYPQLNIGTSYWTNPMFYAILNDAFRELSMITPGRYIHIGGDEAYQISKSEYRTAVDSILALVHKYGKLVDGWEDIAVGRLPAGSIVQHWKYPADSVSTPAALAQGAKTVISRANKLYLDQKYNASSKFGLSWAGYIEVQDAYEWDPAAMLTAITEDDIAGVESPLWSETTSKIADVEYLAFPRVIGHAEIGWSPRTGRSWNEYKIRLGLHGLRLAAKGINFYRSTQVPWQHLH